LREASKEDTNKKASTRIQPLFTGHQCRMGPGFVEDKIFLPVVVWGGSNWALLLMEGKVFLAKGTD